MVFQHFHHKNSFKYKGFLHLRHEVAMMKMIDFPMVFQHFHCQNTFVYKGILITKTLKNHRKIILFTSKTLFSQVARSFAATLPFAGTKDVSQAPPSAPWASP